MNNIIDICTYMPLENDKFFFDANIWMYLYCPIGNYKKDVINKYSSFLKKAYNAKSSIFISSLVLSEFFNAWIGLDFNILKGSDPSKYTNFKRKDFRSTKSYKNSATTIKTVVTKDIMKITKRTDDKFENIILDKLFNEIEASDFNDNYYLAMADLEKFKMVTNDYDFAFSRKILVPILTANKEMLKRA